MLILCWETSAKLALLYQLSKVCALTFVRCEALSKTSPYVIAEDTADLNPVTTAPKANGPANVFTADPSVLVPLLIRFNPPCNATALVLTPPILVFNLLRSPKPEALAST